MEMNGSFQNFTEQINYQAGRYADPNGMPPYMNMNEGSVGGSGYQSGWHTQGGNPIEADMLQQELKQSPQFSQQHGQYIHQGQQGMQGQQPGSQFAMGQEQRFGAHELMEVHEVLTHHIDGINQFEMYRPYIKDQNLMQIMDSQLGHMYNGYQNMVNYIHAMGGGQAVPYRVPKGSGIQYGLRQPSPVQPNAAMDEMDDRDVASGMLGCTKSSALLCTTAALECADYNLRNMMLDCAVSSVNQAYEVFQYMNQAGMYQVPTLAQQTTETMTNMYQPGTAPTM